MKAAFLFLAFWCLAFPCPGRAGEGLPDPLDPLDLPDLLDPLAAIGADGSITLADGSAFYTFSKGGGFLSGPLRGDGRRLEGHWKAREGGRIVVHALCLRVEEGASREDGFRRIVFRIGPGRKRSFRDRMVPAITEFDAYLEIEELVRIPALPAPATP